MTAPEPIRAWWYAALALQEGYRETPWGAIVASSRYPGVWESNMASVLEDCPGLTSADIRALLLPALDLSGATHEHIEFMDLADHCPALDQLWPTPRSRQADAVMAFDEPQAAPVVEGGSVEVLEVRDPDEAFWARFRLLPHEFGQDLPEVVLDQMLDRVRDVFVPAGMRFFVGKIDGRTVGWATLLSLQGAGYVDNVVTERAFRRRGVASATLRRAVAEAGRAGDSLVWLLTEQGSRPQALYERLGFRVRCLAAGFTRPLGDQPTEEAPGP